MEMRLTRSPRLLALRLGLLLALLAGLLAPGSPLAGGAAPGSALAAGTTRYVATNGNRLVAE